MRHEPIEFGLTNASPRRLRSATLSKSARSGAVRPLDLPTADVIDAAFARLEESGVRASSATSAGSNRYVFNKTLVANLAAQLNALDHQREQLAQLLRSVDANLIVD